MATGDRPYQNFCQSPSELRKFKNKYKQAVKLPNTIIEINQIKERPTWFSR